MPLCVFMLLFFFLNSEFKLQPIAAYLLHSGDEMSGAVTGAGGYYACGANVATRACGRESQRVRWGNINGGIKWWWQQKMAVSSNMVLMDLFALFWVERGNRDGVSPRVSVWHSVITLPCQLCRMRPAFCNIIRLPSFYASWVILVMHWCIAFTDYINFFH